MRILYINYTDAAGSRFNGFDTLNVWEERGHEARMLVWHKSSLDTRVEAFWPHARARQSLERRMRLDATLSLQAVLPPGAQYILRHPFFAWAEVVHLQLLHTVMFFSLWDLAQLARRKPTVWTLHDLWPLTGHCIHPEGCEQWRTGCAVCPAPERLMPLTRPSAGLLWKYKKQCYARANVDTIVSSRWMQSHAEASPLLQGKPLHVVPFALRENSGFYAPPDTSLRQVLGIDPQAFIITFRASWASFKRLDFILQALERWQPSCPVHLVTLDQCGGLHSLRGRYPVTELGWISNERLMAAVYHMSDVLLTPSHESFCMMALEALACGTPVICLKNSAVEELCEAPLAGLSVLDGDVAALVEALEMLGTSPELRHGMGRNAKNISQGKYNFLSYFSNITQVYAEACQRFAENERGKPHE